MPEGGVGTHLVAGAVPEGGVGAHLVVRVEGAQQLRGERAERRPHQRIRLAVTLQHRRVAV